jgi:hypothetical protein
MPFKQGLVIAETTLSGAGAVSLKNAAGDEIVLSNFAKPVAKSQTAEPVDASGDYFLVIEFYTALPQLRRALHRDERWSAARPERLSLLPRLPAAGEGEAASGGLSRLPPLGSPARTAAPPAPGSGRMTLLSLVLVAIFIFELGLTVALAILLVRARRARGATRRRSGTRGA